MGFLNLIGQYWIGAIATGTVTVAGIFIKKLWGMVKKEHDEQICLRKGMVAILHDRLYQLCEEYIRADEITVAELNNLKYLYLSYKELGGNGTGDELYKRCQKLKLKED